MHYSFDTGTADNFDEYLESILKQGCDCIYLADSLEELAAKTGIVPDGLLTTVNEYNRACAIGYDNIFKKNPKYLLPVKQPKFYAGRLIPAPTAAWGVLKSTTRPRLWIRTTM